MTCLLKWTGSSADGGPHPGPPTAHAAQESISSIPVAKISLVFRVEL